jgi:hypothetical protein
MRAESQAVGVRLGFQRFGFGDGNLHGSPSWLGDTVSVRLSKVKRKSIKPVLGKN